LIAPRRPDISPRRWSPRSLAILILAWFILQIGGLFSPGLLDDVDSVYIEIAREMMLRHDYVTPYINGIRFFDKPPLMYWMAAGSMHIFGIHDWAARLPLALAVLALLLAVYALGIRLFSGISPATSPDRASFYAALAMATSIGPYLYTRFYIPDILLALWMTLAVHFFFIALDRIHSQQSALVPCLAFAAVMALNVLTKGLIGLVFPIAFVLFYLAITKQLQLFFKLHLLASTATFLVLAAPWHILAAVRNPAIALPQGLGLPATGGWAWFYLYNEHIARFLSKRIPHDYGLTPVWLFWLYLVLWIMPWAIFVPSALADNIRKLRRSQAFLMAHSANESPAVVASQKQAIIDIIQRNRQNAIILLLWITIILGFFSISNRQEYYSLPALPALALMAAGLLARADHFSAGGASEYEIPRAAKSAHRWHLYALVPITTLVAIVCGYYALTAPRPAPGTDIVSLLAMAGSTEAYNLSLSHITDLTASAMGLFRGPLAATAIGMLGIGLISYLIRRRGRTYPANLTLAAAMIVTLLAAHEGLARFYPILGSKGLALAINQAQQAAPLPDDLIIIDGELTAGSTLIFYTGQQVHLINGRVNGLWFGSFWPDSPPIFETEESLRQLWASPRRIFLFTYDPTTRTTDLNPHGSVHTLASAGGKTVLTNH
jgi:4-amino-4-deoxy-L-arabinose transferase-like glycosyltransferase